jgi:hypothetical protein
LPVDVRAAFDISNRFHVLRFPFSENARCPAEIVLCHELNLAEKRRTGAARGGRGVCRGLRGSLGQND